MATHTYPEYHAGEWGDHSPLPIALGDAVYRQGTRQVTGVPPEPGVEFTSRFRLPPSAAYRLKGGEHWHGDSAPDGAPGPLYTACHRYTYVTLP